MTEPSGKSGAYKTLAVRLPNALHSQLELIVRVDDSTMGAALLAAAEFYVEAKRSAPDFAEKAQAVIAEAEVQAAAARQAVEALLRPAAETPVPGESPVKPGTRGAK
ncbi:hypothetical protein [Pseudofrankia sp. EUN1h]|uniref:hypothetical protein n=2 Tax=Pseudofrankia TaxID=2994363 RepID=UPI000234C853|nr:hypothetical protein [Pseudofrankia sp. EUN1h]